MTDVSKQDALAELRRRGIVTGGDTSVLETKKEQPTSSEIKNAVEALLKGSAKGVVNIVGGWGNLIQELSNKPNPLSSQSIVNTIASLGGPDLNKIEGWQGLYKLGEAGAPAAMMSPLGGNLFKMSTPARTAAAEFGAAGGLGLLSQSVAPESPLAQVVMQTLPYAVKGGVQGLKNRSTEKRIEEYRSMLPKADQNIFDTFILKGQGSTDPVIANDIIRLTNSTKYAELIANLNAGASAKALEGMTPPKSKLSDQQAAIAAAEAVQNKLLGLKEHGADSLFDKARKYGGDTPIVEPTNTLNAIDDLIARYSKAATPNAEKAVAALKSIRDKIATPKAAPDMMAGLANAPAPTTAKTVSEVQGILSEFGKKANQGDQLIKDLALSDEKIISSAIFGGMQDDLRTAFNTSTGADKTALGLLRQARDRVATSVEKYNNALAQGLPDWLQNKSLRDINFEELSAQYNKLTPDQRAYARTLIGDTDAEALKALDKQVYDNFVNQARTKNAVGQDVIDLGMLAQQWKNMSPVDKNNLITALGTNASEFEQRMKYADVFSKRMRLAPEAEKGGLDNQTIREASAVAGASGGYQVGKITQLGLDIANMFGKNGGLTEDQLAKLLLPKEGLDFLKNASISPRGQKTLESLMTLDKAELPAFYQIGGQAGRLGARAGQADQPSIQQPSVETPSEVPQISPEEALQELKARGVL